MGMAGAPLPFYNSYVNPDSAFAIGYTVNAMAMPLVGGMQNWLGPVVGAVLLGLASTARGRLHLVVRQPGADRAGVHGVCRSGAARAHRSLSIRGGQGRRAMNAPLLHVQRCRQALRRLRRAARASRSVVAPGERVGLIGPNGSGKSTFVNCLGGAFARHDGAVAFDGAPLRAASRPIRRARLGLARTFQLPRPFASLTVLENVEVPLALPWRRGRPDVGARAGPPRTRRSRDKARLRPRDLTQVDLRRLELARALACRPKLLIADEAMAGLSHAEVDEILALLFRANADGVAVIMIEHIMRAVTAFAERLVVFVAGRKIADGPTPEVLR